MVVEVYVQLGGSGALDPGTHKGGKAVSHSVRNSDPLWYSDCQVAQTALKDASDTQGHTGHFLTFLIFWL